MQLYDRIGLGYRRSRREDARIAARILDALDGLSSVINVGAGAGSYEPRDRRVVAVEPSDVMIRQRTAEAAPVVRASASHLPFADGAFAAALAVLTIHHWPDLELGLAELRRTARERVVVLTHDAGAGALGFWLEDYLPELRELSRRSLPSLDEIRRCLGASSVVDVPVPHDCCDGFLGAFWRRPHSYLDPAVRAGISVFAELPGVELGLAALQSDLASGEWRRRYGWLLGRDELDLGYRLVIA